MVKYYYGITNMISKLHLLIENKIDEIENKKIIEETVMPKALASYTIKSRNNRGVIFYDYRS